MGMVIGNQEIIGCVVGNKLVYEADPIVTINYVLKDTGESVGTYDIPFVKTGTADEKDVMNVSDSQDENGNYVAKGHIPGGYRGYVTGTGVWEDLNSAKNALPWSQLNYWVKENNRTQQINVQFIDSTSSANLWTSISKKVQDQFVEVSKDSRYQILQGQELTSSHVEEVINAANMRQILLSSGKTANFIKSDSTLDTNKNIVPVNAYYDVVDGHSLYSFGDSSGVLTGDKDLGNGNTPFYKVKGISGGKLKLSEEIQNQKTGVQIIFENTSADYYYGGFSGWNANGSGTFTIPENPVLISKEAPSKKIIVLDNLGTQFNVDLKIQKTELSISVNGVLGSGISTDFDRFLAIKYILSY